MRGFAQLPIVFNQQIADADRAERLTVEVETVDV